MAEKCSKYEMIKKRIEEQISKGVYKENDKIPSENDLCRSFDSSRITVRKALDELVAVGVLYRQQGIGTFVKSKTSEEKVSDVHKVLLVLPNYPELFCAGIVSDMLTGIQKALRETEFSLVTLMEPRNEEDIEKFLQSIKNIKPEGIIYSFYYGNSLIDELKKLSIPIVFLDAEPKDNEFDVVTGEDFESAYRVTQLAIMAGMENVGFYSSWNRDFSTCNARFNGIKKALEDSRIPIHEGQLMLRDIESEFHEAVTKYDMVTDIKKYLQQNTHLDVLIVMNDTVAFSAYKAASELQKKIPEDLKMISYGNYNWSSFPTIGLTTYEQHFSKYGKEAVKLLLKRMSGNTSMIQQRRIIKYDLQRRNSF